MVWYVPPLSPISAAANAGEHRRVRRASGRALAAHSGAVPRQPAHRGRRGARRGGARADAGDARVHARPPRREARERRRAEAGRAVRRRGRGRCTATWRSPTTRTASSSRPRTANTPRTPSTCAAAAASRSATAARTARRDEPVRRQEEEDHPDRRRSRRGARHERTYKALAALLAYPSAELVAALPEIAASLDREPRLDRPRREALAALIAWLARADLLDAQESYVALFDRGPRDVAASVRARARRFARRAARRWWSCRRCMRSAGLKPSINELPGLPAR